MDNPSNELSLNFQNLGYSRHQKGEYENACEDYLRSIEINPNNGKTHYLMGLSLTKLGLYDDAMKRFEKAIEVDKDNSSIYFYNLAKLKFIQKDFVGAIKGYTSFIDSNIKLKETDVIYLKAYFERANAHRNLNNRFEAILDWSYVVELIKLRNQLTLEDEDIYEQSIDFGEFLRKKNERNSRDHEIYTEASYQLSRERISDLRTHEELKKLTTIEKLALFDDLEMYEEWVKSDYTPKALKKKIRNKQI
mgnify:CR=1 FL=1|tara:strand:+ start:72 stop:818 length:747 start_codon:yes stop_codon:yes gene_type:complete